MSRRAFIVVLDAVGAGELPDAAAWGDEGSNTLAHVAEAVGGLHLPEPAGARPRQRAAAGGLPAAGRRLPRSAGRLLERSQGKDTTVGHWELTGIVTERPFPTYPDGFPEDLLDAFAQATGRGVIGNVAASGTEIIERLGDEHQRTGKWIVYTSADSRLPDRRARGDGAAGGAVRGLPHRRATAHGAERGRARDRAPVRGHARRVPPHARTATTSRSSRRGRTTSRGSARPAAASTASARSATSSPAATSTSRTRRAPTREGLASTIALARERRPGLVFVNLVETDMTYGHRNDPRASTAACRRSTPRSPTCSARSARTTCWCSPRITAAIRRRRRRITRASTRCSSRTCPGRGAGRAPRRRVRRRRRDGVRRGSARRRVTACRSSDRRISSVRAVDLIARKRDGGEHAAGRAARG